MAAPLTFTAARPHEPAVQVSARTRREVDLPVIGLEPSEGYAVEAELVHRVWPVGNLGASPGWVTDETLNRMSQAVKAWRVTL